MNTRSLPYSITRPTTRVLLALTFGLIFVGDSQALESETANLEGAWSGGGVVMLGAEQQKARCRAKYTARSKTTYHMVGTCALASGTISQIATLKKTGQNRYSGNFYNQEYEVSGTILVTVSGKVQRAILQSNNGSASLSLTR